MTNRTLTANVTVLPQGENQLWMIEADLEYGHATAGLASVSLNRDGHGELYIESYTTGGCYRGPSIINGSGDDNDNNIVETWNAEKHFIALFRDEESMWAGAQQLVAGFGDRLPVGVARVIIR
jgi:hypothetical protein